jgi:DNA-binding GntR family transcriptional regulator
MRPGWRERVPEATVEYLSKSEVVAIGIRDLIQNGEMGPGQVLRQRDLAERFQVSPTPVREALRKLEAEGFVTSELHHGATVVRAHDSRVYENFLIRAALESLAAGLAAEKATEADIKDAEAILDRLEHKRLTNAEATSLNRDFHFRIYETADSPTLISLLRMLWRSLGGEPQVKRPDRESGEHHRAMLDAIIRHDGDAAAEVTRMHIMRHASLGPEAEPVTNGHKR